MATTPKKQRGHTPGKSAAPTTRVDDTALVHLRGNEPVTDSLTIAREFGRPHKNVLQSLDSLIADGTINRLDFEPVEYGDAKGERRRMLELTERGALVTMPFVGGRNSRTGHLRILNRLQVRDAAMIGAGKSYAERKSLLAEYANTLRANPRLTGGVA